MKLQVQCRLQVSMQLVRSVPRLLLTRMVPMNPRCSICVAATVVRWHCSESIVLPWPLHQKLRARPQAEHCAWWQRKTFGV